MSFEDGRRALILANAAYRSVETGQAVTVNYENFGVKVMSNPSQDTAQKPVFLDLLKYQQILWSNRSSKGDQHAIVCW